MGYLKYKGYTGSVEYSEEDNCLFGKVQGMSKDAITYEGTTIEELRQDFEGAIDDYLALCEARHVEPAKAIQWYIQCTGIPRDSQRHCHACPRGWRYP